MCVPTLESRSRGWGGVKVCRSPSELGPEKCPSFCGSALPLSVEHL